MNRYQRIVLSLAAINALLMLLFPPFNNLPLARGYLPSFDGFYPLASTWGNKPVHEGLLFLEIVWLSSNTLAAWLALQHRGDEEIPRFRFIAGIGLFAAVNAVLVGIFPPFEPYSGINASGGSFDSFYFVFGDRSHRAIFMPLLQLEFLWIAINALSLVLLFSAIERHDNRAREKILHLADELPDEAVIQLAHELEKRAADHHPPARPH